MADATVELFATNTGTLGVLTVVVPLTGYVWTPGDILAGLAWAGEANLSAPTGPSGWTVDFSEHIRDPPTTDLHAWHAAWHTVPETTITEVVFGNPEQEGDSVRCAVVVFRNGDIDGYTIGSSHAALANFPGTETVSAPSVAGTTGALVTTHVAYRQVNTDNPTWHGPPTGMTVLLDEPATRVPVYASKELAVVPPTGTRTVTIDQGALQDIYYFSGISILVPSFSRTGWHVGMVRGN